MAHQLQMNVANFTCKFGENKVMLDFYNEIVWPAFKSSHVRTYGDIRFFLHGVQLIDLKGDGKELAIAGRLIKKMSVSRDQIFDDGKIIQDHLAIDSAPTSFFTLILSNHKLLYVRETNGAPPLSAFRSTVLAFLKNSHIEYINKEYDKFNKSKIHAKKTKSALLEEVPTPTLEVTPLATDDSLSEFIGKFKAINSVEIRLIDTNHELDNKSLLKSMRGMQKTIGADRTVLRTVKNGEVGLDKAGVEELVNTPAKEGNTKIKLTGTGLGGDPLRAENESFNVTIPIKVISKRVDSTAKYLYDKLTEQVDLGVIKFQSVSRRVRSLIDKIIDKGE